MRSSASGTSRAPPANRPSVAAGFRFKAGAPVPPQATMPVRCARFAHVRLWPAGLRVLPGWRWARRARQARGRQCDQAGGAVATGAACGLAPEPGPTPGRMSSGASASGGRADTWTCGSGADWRWAVRP